MQIRPGAAFGRYTIDAELGRGGMGLVYLATDSVLERKVALKMIAPGLDSLEVTARRFFREAKLAAQLSHANTVHIYDLGDVEGVPFIAMEYVDGKTLTAYLGDNTVPAERRMRWLIDAAKGLGAAHARGLIHRDMKPANVMVTKEGVAKVLDFGLAKKERATAEMKATFQTTTDFVVGTPAYMSPEQLEGIEPIDARADQFGWALTAYALFLGKNIRKDDPLLFGPIPLLSDRVPGLSRRTAEIVMRALSNDRDMRFPSMDALVAELEPALAMPPSMRMDEGDPPSQRLTLEMPGAPARIRPFCPDCGLPVAMPSSACAGPHAEGFPKP
jgi:serine/threonine-protein kinase